MAPAPEEQEPGDATAVAFAVFVALGARQAVPEAVLPDAPVARAQQPGGPAGQEPDAAADMALVGPQLALPERAYRARNLRNKWHGQH